MKKKKEKINKQKFYNDCGLLLKSMITKINIKKKNVTQFYLRKLL